MEETRRKKPKHYVLIHGASHGAWCWYKVLTHLKSQGHRVTALDLAASGVNPTRAEELNSIFDYSQPLMDFMTSLDRNDEELILVGHSLGGICISIAMENFPQKIDCAVFVAGFMPGHDFTTSEIDEEFQKNFSYMDCRFVYRNGEDKPPTSCHMGPEFMATKLYQLSPSEDLALATSLMRPFGLFDSKIYLSQEKHGSVRRVFIVCEEDLVMTKEFQGWMIEKNPPNMVRMISRADHMVMFSKWKELSEVLLHDLD